MKTTLAIIFSPPHCDSVVILTRPIAETWNRLPIAFTRHNDFGMQASTTTIITDGAKIWNARQKLVKFCGHVQLHQNLLQSSGLWTRPKMTASKHCGLTQVTGSVLCACTITGGVNVSNCWNRTSRRQLPQLANKSELVVNQFYWWAVQSRLNFDNHILHLSWHSLTLFHTQSV